MEQYEGWKKRRRIRIGEHAFIAAHVVNCMPFRKKALQVSDIMKNFADDSVDISKKDPVQRELMRESRARARKAKAKKNNGR